MYQAHRAALSAGHVQLALENPFLHESGNGPMAEAKHLGRQGLADPGSLSEGRTFLGFLKQADLAIEMATRIMLDEILSQGHGGRGCPSSSNLAAWRNSVPNRRPTPVDVVLCLSIC